MYSILQANSDMIDQKVYVSSVPCWIIVDLQLSIQVHIANTFHVARCLGLEASKRKVKAYVRFVPAIYQTLERGSHDEKEAITPFGNIGKWTHEALRALGNMAAYVIWIIC